MNKFPILCALAAVAAFPQAQTPLTITQSAGSATGELRMQERRTNGQNYVGIKAPQSIASSLTFALPSSDGQANDCLQTDGAGQWVFGDCGGERLVSDYNWTQVLGARSGSGAITLTFTGTNCPAAGTDTAYRYRLYETSTPTTYELATSNGTGTCVRGGAGTIVASGPTGTYTNATATSASAGWQEAFYSVADGAPVRVRATEGVYDIYSDILAGNRTVTVDCDSSNVVLYPRTDGMNVFNTSADAGGSFYRCSINNTAYEHADVTGVLMSNSGGDSYGGKVIGMSFNFVQTAIHAATAYKLTIFDNTILDATSKAIWLENVTTPDGDTGVVSQNTLHCTGARGACTYGVYWTGPGGFELVDNKLNGFTTQIYLEPAATSSQLEVKNNRIDSGANTAYSIRYKGVTFFESIQFVGNFISNWSNTSHIGISVEDNGGHFVGIRGNHIQSSVAGTTIGINLAGGVVVDISGNQVINSNTAYKIGAGADIVKLENNQCHGVYITDCFTSALATATIRMAHPTTYTQLAALTVADGSVLYCSNCKQTSASSATCATGGSGATATRINGAWKCEDGTVSEAFLRAGNSFGAAAELGTNDAYALYIRTNNTNYWRFPTTGHLWAETNNTVDIGAGISSNSPRNIYAATSMVTPKIGRDSSASFTIMTDSADRWIFNSAGMLNPAAADTYDIGSTNRVRGVYAKFGEFYKSGSTSASDYVETRNYKFKDATGSTGSWDMKADVTATVSQLFSRDNAGDPFRYSVRQSSGSPVNYEILYASLIPEKRNTGLGHTVTDATFPKLGTSSQPWSEIWGTNGDFAGDLTIDGTTVANVVNYASGTMAGTMKPLFGGTGSIGASGYSYGAAFFSASGFTLTDTTTVGYVWTATSTGGAGSWQAAGGGWTVSGSDIYRATGIATIGHTSPIVRLGQNFNVNYANDYSGMAINTWSATDAHGGVLDFNKSGSGTIGTHAAVASGETLGLLIFRGSEGTVFRQAAQITSEVDGTVSSGVVPGRILIRTTNSSGTTTERMRIDSAGLASFYAGVDVTGNLSAAVINATGSPAYRVGGTTVIDSSRNASFAGLTIATGAASGYVWTSDGAGVGSWQAAAAGLPVVDTTGIAKGSSDATKIVRFEVDGFTTGTTRVLTPPNADATIAGLNVTQTFVNPQTVAIASVQNQMTLAQTNSTAAYDPACLVLASTDTVTSTIYGAARLCSGYESASFTNEKFAIQTATGSGTYQDAVTFKNQVATFAGDITATVGTFSFSSGTMSGTMKPLFNSTGKIGDTSYYYANGYFTTADIGTIEASTAYKMGGTTVINSSRNVVGVNTFAQNITFSAGSTYNVGSTGAPPLNVYGNYIEPITELVFGSGVGFRGSFLPVTNNLYPLGNTSLRWSNIATVNANFSGTITAPSGSTGFSGTLTVRAAGGGSDCTIVVSGGFLTAGGTC